MHEVVVRAVMAAVMAAATICQMRIQGILFHFIAH